MGWKEEFEYKFMLQGGYINHERYSDVVSFIENLLEQERKRIMSLPCMEEEKIVGDPSDVLTASRNFLRRELKEAIINK